MSHVTSVILTTSLLDGPLDDDRDTAAEQLGTVLGFERLGDRAGGNKKMQAEVWLAAFNHLDLPGLVQKLRALPWVEPQSVQLFVKCEHDEGFAEYPLAL